MGSKSGKYNLEHESSSGSDTKASSSLSSNSNGSVASERLTKNEASLPTFIDQNPLIDALPSDKDCATLVWLDTEINNRSANIDTQIKLKNVINYLRIFDRVDECKRYIDQIDQMNDTENINQEKLFVIISSTLALTVIPYLHDLSPVKYFYIYGTSKTDVKINEQLLKKCTKVKGIFTTSRSLLSEITQDYN